ncbi:SMI1/KNR4 family protein [Shouchella hunanensis]|uniref:SMI1/KNR4 family protein n=1 Tax=Shouchella hunanensis TaxID=766894 RepID=A0ABY7W0B3_9BACI|nr:SMI1/KNR4 family protein [Shouchella hunanensis]WDF02372.1 SMI1/KNR4 family protein [Shouchella hunanensis]
MNKKLTKQLDRIVGNENYELNEGATIEQIHAWEECHKLSLPETYKELLLTGNGGDLDGLILAELYDEHKAYNPEKDLYIEPVIKTMYAEVTKNKHLIILAMESFGDMYFLHVDNEFVYHWSHETNKVKKRWKGIEGFLKTYLDEDEVKLFF